jgi:adenosyl cobinamide kinase/adenosyl cobinamide phosphate guanylyltransferase
MGKFVLTGEIQKAIKEDAFLGCVVYGPMRVGKSSYAMQCLHQVYGNWEDVASHTVFRLEDMIHQIERAMDTNSKIPALLWDDAGVHGNRLRYFQNRQLCEYLEDLIDTIGLHLHALLMRIFAGGEEVI